MLYPVPMKAFRLLHMVARRGNARDFPENTLLALRSALELGARFIEIDVHLSSDGTPMVVHDRQLARVANFEDLSASQLALLDIGQPVRFGDAATSHTRLQPRLGEHSVEILREAGLAETAIEALLVSGATVDPNRKAQAAE